MRFLLFLLLVSFTLTGFGQCDAFPILLQKGDRLLKSRQPDYQEAINAYTAAIIACPERAQEAQARISGMVNSINGLRRDAQQALLQVKEEQGKTQTALDRAQQLVNVFYFYDDRFALADNNNHYYFIDKDGKRVGKLGRWRKAEHFGSQGFAKVYKDKDRQEYLLDTFGNLYPVVYDIGDMSPKITALDLSRHSLKELPDHLFVHQQLEILLLNRNKLSALPQHFGQLNNLTHLFLEHNQLTELPESFGNLNKLTTLNLPYNQLTQLPQSFGRLSNLVFLNLISNQLTELPENFGQLHKLTTLKLPYNQLTQLPENFGQLNNLFHLNLANNHLTDLPQNFGQLNNLSFIMLRSNHLMKLPQSFGQLNNLSRLDLSSNKLTELPQSFTQLNSLSHLNLSHNQLAKLPDSFEHLNNLTYLALNSNQLTKLPQSFEKLRNLKELELYSNPISSLSHALLKKDAISTQYIVERLSNYGRDSLYTDALHLRQKIQSRKFDLSEYFRMSWTLVHCHDFEGAIWAGEAYVAAGGTNVHGLSKLAMGYLYNGDYEQAMAIYTPNKATVSEGDKRTGQEIFLEDLDAASHLTAKKPEDVARARTFLEK